MRRLIARVGTVQRWMALDLWVALGGNQREFEQHIDMYGFADTWAELLAATRQKAAQ